MPYTREDWPIAAALLQSPGTAPDGTSVQDVDATAWVDTLADVAGVGFRHLDLTDSWLRIGDLSAARLREFELAAAAVGLSVPSLSITRRSVIDPEGGLENLAYAHRTIDAAAAIGVSVLSIGLHRPLTAEQREQLWFWTAPGASDPVGDPEVWSLAVSRIRELADHAAETGMLVSLELYEDTYLGTADSAVALVHDIDRDNVGINPDIGNLVRLHRPIESWQEMLAKTLPLTNYWQVKNYFRDEDPRTGSIVSIPAPLELGFINYRVAVREALSLGFQGVLCCEHYGGDGLGVSAMNLRYLRTLLPADAATAASRENSLSEGRI
jgi:sugar phosphate isomerase/epimerase